MKSLIVLFALVAVTLATTLTQEQIAKLEPLSKECREKTGATIEQITKLRQGVVVDDPKVKKHALCLAVKIGTMSESGDINVDVIKEKLKKNGADDVLVADIETHCLVKKATPEETALEMGKCIAKKKDNYSPAD